MLVSPPELPLYSTYLEGVLVVYEVAEGRGSWAQQEAQCRLAGGTVVSLATRQEDTQLQAVLTNDTSLDTFWLGLKMCAGGSGECRAPDTQVRVWCPRYTSESIVAFLYKGIASCFYLCTTIIIKYRKLFYTEMRNRETLLYIYNKTYGDSISKFIHFELKLRY